MPALVSLGDVAGGDSARRETTAAVGTRGDPMVEKDPPPLSPIENCKEGATVRSQKGHSLHELRKGKKGMSRFHRERGEDRNEKGEQKR